MLDIKLFRENPDIIKKDLKKRKDVERLKDVDEVIELDKEKRKLLFDLQNLKHERNNINNEINKAKKKGSDISKLVLKAKSLPAEIKGLEEELEKIDFKLRHHLMKLPNIMHETVPYGRDENDNKEVRKWGSPRKAKAKKAKVMNAKVMNHAEAAERLDIIDFERAAKIAGRGFYFLKGGLAQLNHALIRFAVDFLIKKDYVFIEPPLMINRKVADGVTDFEFFRDMIYKIEADDLHMIATSEHPLMGMYMDETIAKEKLPLKFVAYSQCFRKEIGSHGVDEKGLFRVHQFHKVEQVVLCEPKDSWKIFEELINNCEEMFKLLELPHRVVNICTGDLGIVASKKYDLEVWLPRQEKYREACSCSNCTDYQARRLNIKYGIAGQPGNELVHSLNSTAIATSRALVAILENNQNTDGSINVPKALWPYMGGIRVIKAKKRKEEKTKEKNKLAKAIKSKEVDKKKQ